ncbi:MAG: metal-dependent transcriptional regulator [Clostridiales bacterium]|nr:metal-dependent transcriptional regulator [Clostridiales bacterium]
MEQRMRMNDIQKNRMKQICRESREDYLEAMLLLREQMEEIRSSDLAAYMGFSRASVSQAVLSLEKEGFLVMDEKYCLHLTEKGLLTAERIHRKHIFFEKNLVLAGVDPVLADREGSRMGHALSNESFERIAADGMRKEEELNSYESSDFQT